MKTSKEQIDRENSEINPYQADSLGIDKRSKVPPPLSTPPSNSSRMLYGCVWASTITVTMLVSLSASFANGLIDVVTSGFLFRGGILVYASRSLLYLPILNLLGAFICVASIPHLRSPSGRLRFSCTLLVSHLYCYFVTQSIDTQELVKNAMLSGQSGQLSLASIIIVGSIWFVAFSVTMAATQLNNSVKNEKH